MKNLKEFNSKIEFVLTDIDDTLTTEGQLHSGAYRSLWQLHDAGLKVIPITGRPAGWCELIARQWPVAGVVGENGGFYFHYSDKKMQRWFSGSSSSESGSPSSGFVASSSQMQGIGHEQSVNQIANRKKLDLIQAEILKSVAGSALASDQFCRLMDLAIDFCEDVQPLAPQDIQKIVDIFTRHGAQAKVSSIHVNGWFGSYNKLSTTFQFLNDRFNVTRENALKKCMFVGDSPNDEPMFQEFPLSFGVANVLNFKESMKHLPKFIASKKGGEGFSEIADQILKSL